VLIWASLKMEGAKADCPTGVDTQTLGKAGPGFSPGGTPQGPACPFPVFLPKVKFQCSARTRMLTPAPLPPSCLQLALSIPGDREQCPLLFGPEAVLPAGSLPTPSRDTIHR
jgi:hypothetical protein